MEIAMTKKALLLLSGEKDSKQPLEILLSQGDKVSALCMSGHKKSEELGAKQAAANFNISLKIVHVTWFSEKNRNHLKLIYRDLGMGVIAIRHAKKLSAESIACGVKPTDFETRPWFRYFLIYGRNICF
jgi:7-cyano-7-deazaguanine synthase in queuosine biosynthesis